MAENAIVSRVLDCHIRDDNVEFENYEKWRIQVKTYLLGQGPWDVIVKAKARESTSALIFVHGSSPSPLANQASNGAAMSAGDIIGGCRHNPGSCAAPFSRKARQRWSDVHQTQ
ncbi:hypothetical protein PanWU01x14_366150 [Parasponia andersonii]|uniref:Uncharacterized protein n=1 Tax=Parasponia andersonii TaxID=3476 RepID=A0A2P5A5P7_PARAD|nr:hypothetical protein PanWU01x14_366150 [Parasponia andersonii]